jgi:hypothetical protein
MRTRLRQRRNLRQKSMFLLANAHMQRFDVVVVAHLTHRCAKSVRCPGRRSQVIVHRDLDASRGTRRQRRASCRQTRAAATDGY